MLRGIFRIVCFIACSRLHAAALEGKIIENHSGNPVPNADVRVYSANSRTLAADLETDHDGRFSASRLAAGEYRIEISKANYVPATLRTKVEEASAPAQPLAVRLIRYGVIAGQVTDQQGHPLTGAHIFAGRRMSTAEPFRPMEPGSPGAMATVDSQGKYRLYGLPPGQYLIVASYGASSMTVGQSGAASVSAELGSGAVYYPSNSRPQIFAIQGGEEIRNIDFLIASQALANVSGKVAGASNDQPFWLALTPEEQPAIAYAVAIAGKDGAFQFGGVPPGSYSLFVAGPAHGRASKGAMLDANPQFGRTRIVLNGQNIENLEISVQPGRFAKFVFESSPGCPATGQIRLASLEDWASNLDQSAEVTAGKPVVLQNLAPARYLVKLSQSGTSCFAGEQILDLSRTQSESSVKLLVKPAATLQGSISGAQPAESYAVILLPADRLRQDPARIAYPDANSHFRFEDVRPGKYRIAVHAASAGPFTAEGMQEIEAAIGQAEISVQLAAPPVSKH